jgi:YVTN family beta-propeller protein
MRGVLGMFMAGLMATTMSAARAQQQNPGPSLLVLAKKDRQLSIVDPETLQVRAKVPVGGNPHEVQASPDGRTAWVSNYGNGSLHTITVVDLKSARVVKTIDLGPLWGPHGLAYSGGAIYFTAEREKLIGRLNPDLNATGAMAPVDWYLGTGQTGTHLLWVSRDATQIVTVNVGSGTMDLFERKPAGPMQEAGGPPSKAGATTTHGSDATPVPDWDQTIVKVGGLPEGFDVIPDGEGHARTIWVANAREGTVSVIDFASGTVTGTIAAEVPTANRVRFTPDHRLALISQEKSGEVTVLDVASQRVVKRVDVGTGAAGVLIEPTGRRAYVSCSPDNWVAVIDLKTLKVVGRIEPGREPDGLSWAAGGSSGEKSARFR